MSCAFRCPAPSAAVQSNMAATLNIDWFLDVAREAADIAGAATSRAALAQRHGRRASSARRRARRSIIPTYSRRASAGRSLIPTRARNFPACPRATTFAGMMRAVYEGLAFAARDCYLASGADSARSAARRRRGALDGAPHDPRLRARRERAHRQARGDGRGGRGDDGGRASWPLCRYAGLRRSMGHARRSAIRRRPTLASPNSTGSLFEAYLAIRRAMPPAWAAAWQDQTGDIGVKPAIAIIGDRFMLPSMFEKAIRAKCGERSRHPRVRTALAGRADAARLCGGRHGRAEGISGRRGRDRRHGRRR